MFRAICIKRYNNYVKGDIIKVSQGVNGSIYCKKGFKVQLKLQEEEFFQYFAMFKNYYIIEKPLVKRRFRKPKKEYLRVEFPEASDELLILLYNNVFSYLELVENLNPEMIQVFNYSIVTTLEKLEYLYKILALDKFIEAVNHSEQVFLGVYKTALSIDIEVTPRDNNELLESFKVENDIMGNFFSDLNKR